MSNLNQKEINDVCFTSLKNLAGLSPSPFKAQYHPGLGISIAKCDQNFENLSLTEVSNEFGDWRDTLAKDEQDEIAAFFYLVFMVNFEYLKIFIKVN